MMTKSYHCSDCDKEIVDKDLISEHKKSTGHKVIERVLEK